MVCMPFNPFSLPPSWNVYGTPKKGHTRNRSLNKELGRIRQTPLYFGILVHLNILQFQNESEIYPLFIFMYKKPTSWMSRVRSSSCLACIASNLSFSLLCFIAVILRSSINFLVLFWFFSRKRRSFSALFLSVLSLATSFAVSTATRACRVFKSLFSLQGKNYLSQLSRFPSVWK